MMRRLNPTQQDIHELSLVDQAELEDELAINIISIRANTHYAEELWKLNRRLAVVRGGKKVDDLCNPCGPSHVCQALRYAAQAMDVESKTKIDLYELFEESVLAKAGDFYADLNQQLAENRILPNLKFGVAGSGAGAAAGSTMPGAIPGRASSGC